MKFSVARSSRARYLSGVIVILVAGIAGIGAFMTGYRVDSRTQMAFGAAADAKCTAGNYKYDYRQKTKPCKPEGKEKCMKNFPCGDPDGKTKGHCEAFNKCKGDTIDGKAPMLPMMGMMMPMMGGMPPMLPMIPMGMPGGGDMMPPTTPMPAYCPPKKSPEPTATTSTSTPTSSTTPSRTDDTSAMHVITDPNCTNNPYSQAYNFAANFDSQFNSGSESDNGDQSSGNDNRSSGSGSIWARLMDSLGIGSDDTTDSGPRMQEDFTYTASGTTRTVAQGSDDRVTYGTTTYNGHLVGAQTFVTNDLSEGPQVDINQPYVYSGPGDTFVNGTAQILQNIRSALLRLLAILLSLISIR